METKSRRRKEEEVNGGALVEAYSRRNSDRFQRIFQSEETSYQKENLKSLFRVLILCPFFLFFLVRVYLTSIGMSLSVDKLSITA